LAKNPGLNSGLRIAEGTTAALMSENHQLANPWSTDSTPTSANQEDHVSMAAHGARRLKRMTDNLANILGVELLCGALGVEHRAPLKTSQPLQHAITRLRQEVSALETDRYLAPDLKAACELIASRALLDAVTTDHLVGIEVSHAAC
jgi:histidine ammonia-lyase